MSSKRLILTSRSEAWTDEDLTVQLEQEQLSNSPSLLETGIVPWTDPAIPRTPPAIGV
jgi:hypothetical protein